MPLPQEVARLSTAHNPGPEGDAYRAVLAQIFADRDPGDPVLLTTITAGDLVAGMIQAPGYTDALVAAHANDDNADRWVEAAELRGAVRAGMSDRQGEGSLRLQHFVSLDTLQDVGSDVGQAGFDAQISYLQDTIIARGDVVRLFDSRVLDNDTVRACFAGRTALILDAPQGPAVYLEETLGNAKYIEPGDIGASGPYAQSLVELHRQAMSPAATAQLLGEWSVKST